MKVEYLRTGVLTVDEKSYVLIFNTDGTFQNVQNEERRCVADPAAQLTDWSWEEKSPTKYTFYDSAAEWMGKLK